MTNAAVQQKSTGANPAMTSMQKAAQSYATPKPPAPATTTTPPVTPPATGPTPANPFGGAVPGGKAFPGGPPSPVAGGGYEGENYKTPYGAGSDEWLNKMQADVRSSGAQTMQDNMRSLRGQMAATPGMLDSGAMAGATADMYRRGGNEMQQQLSQAMLGEYGAERNRLADAWATEGGWATQRDVSAQQLAGQKAMANAQLGAANAQANAGAAAAAGQLELAKDRLAWDREYGQAGIGYDYYQSQMDMLNNMLGMGGGLGTNWDDIMSGIGGPGFEKPETLPPPP
jgi:hypothetical protein